jgi:hypothetical protein
MAGLPTEPSISRTPRVPRSAGCCRHCRLAKASRWWLDREITRPSGVRSGPSWNRAYDGFDHVVDVGEVRPHLTLLEQLDQPTADRPGNGAPRIIELEVGELPRDPRCGSSSGVGRDRRCGCRDPLRLARLPTAGAQGADDESGRACNNNRTVQDTPSALAQGGCGHLNARPRLGTRLVAFRAV